MNRRDFMKTSGLAAAGTMLVPQFLHALQGNVAKNGKVLVVIQLGGGNDGLNTIVPYKNDIYYEMRPRLAIPKKEVLKVGTEQGLNPVLSDLRGFFDDGEMAIVNSIGYPNPNRSHFHSTDIWHTGHREGALSTGWIGRYLDASCNGEGCARMAIEVDDSLSLALKGERIKGLAVKDPKKVFTVTQDPFLQSTAKEYVKMGRHDEDEHVDYLYKTLIETLSSAQYLYERSKIYRSTTDYPAVDFGKRMKTIAELIISGVDTSVYYCSLTGFDTHNKQRPRQDSLLEKYAASLKAFMTDLKKNNRDKDVLVMTFSEFGRRVKQNASGGTDHGAANNLFLMSGGLKNGGFQNDAPDLTDLQDGDLKYQVDFRRVYATILKKWLGVNDQSIMGRKYNLMDFI